MTTRRRIKPAEPTCKCLLKWLKLNGLSIGALTGTDSRALAAAVHILELYYVSSSDEAATLEAFRIVVMKMQPSTRQLAYHAIAHLAEWHNRAEIWVRAGLPVLERVSGCEGEPGGGHR